MFLALGSEVEKNPASITALEKNRKRGCTHGDAITWRYMENVKTIFSKNKNSGDSSHQALTYFSFSEFLSSEFRHNKFTKIHHVIFHKIF
jgi:hypothetical protein